MSPPKSLSRIYYAKPSITELEVSYAADAATNGWGERCTQYLDRFERMFCEHLEVRHAIATSSCTGALHMGLAALGVGPGDEVIVPEITWIGSAAPITYLGARPVLVDVDARSWCIDPASAEAAITPRTRAIVAVHLYGNLCDMTSLLRIGREHGIPVVEDAAQAIGSAWHGRRAGAMGAFGAFSFHGTKTLTTGEGGMFATRDSELFEKVLTLANQGRARGERRQFWPERLGFKYKLSNVQAAIGCAQLQRIDELVKRKRRIFEHYAQRLEGLPIAMNLEPPGTVNGCWMTTLVVDPEVEFEREELLRRFAAENIDSRVFFWPLSSLPMFQPKPHNRVSYALHRRGVNLPSYHDLTETEIDRVVAVVRACVPRRSGVGAAKAAEPLDIAAQLP